MQKKAKGLRDVNLLDDLPPYGSGWKWLRHVTRMSYFVYHTRGFIALSFRIWLYIKENLRIIFFILFHSGKDVLFISGCPGGSRYYRCKNQSELLVKYGITSEIYSQHSLNLLYVVDKFDVFVFQRVIYNRYMQRMIDLIKNKGKRIIYETDDLVFDPAYLPFMDYFNQMGEEEKKWYKNGIGREILENKSIKYCVAATDFLAEAIRKKYPEKKVFVSYNKMGNEQVLRAQTILPKANQFKANDGKVRIGYFSGSKSHNNDFNVISNVILKILEENKNVVLMVVGFLDLDEKFSKFRSDRIELIPFVPVQKLPELILRSDINIAPLELENPFCQSKSALKYFETGLLQIPTVASATMDFVRCIRNGENGFLAKNPEDWYNYLKQLIDDRELRDKIGKKANLDSIQSHVVGNFLDEKSKEYLNFIDKLLDIKNERTY